MQNNLPCPQHRNRVLYLLLQRSLFIAFSVSFYAKKFHFTVRWWWTFEVIVMVTQIWKGKQCNMSNIWNCWFFGMHTHTIHVNDVWCGSSVYNVIFGKKRYIMWMGKIASKNHLRCKVFAFCCCCCRQTESLIKIRTMCSVLIIIYVVIWCN